jgi:hypothetical protein
MRNTIRAGAALAGWLGFWPVGASGGGRACRRRPITRPATSPTTAATASQAAKPIATHHHGLMPPKAAHPFGESADRSFTNTLSIARQRCILGSKTLHHAITLRCQVLVVRAGRWRRVVRRGGLHRRRVVRPCDFQPQRRCPAFRASASPLARRFTCVANGMAPP